MRSAVYAENSFWDILKDEARPVFLYGTGNGADKILDILTERGIAVCGVFASDSFVRDRFFRGFKVLSYSDVISEYGDDIVILLCFGTGRREVISFIEELDARHTLYIPDVPLYGGELFDAEYYKKNKRELERARSILSDETSREVFDAAVNFRLSGKYRYLKASETLDETLVSLFDVELIHNIIDVGAYKGDTAEVFSSVFPRCGNIYAIEPDVGSFKKLSEYAERLGSGNFGGPKVTPFNFAASDAESRGGYYASSSRGAGANGKNRRAKKEAARFGTVDSLGLSDIDFIKYDVEGDELYALRGSARTILDGHASLAVSAYHRTDDLFLVLTYILDILGESAGKYTFHMRRQPCVPAWDISVYAVYHG